MFAINLSVNDAEMIRDLLQQRFDDLLAQSQQAGRDGEILVAETILEWAQHVERLMNILKLNIQYARENE